MSGPVMKKQLGTALVTALLVVAIASIAAAGLLGRQRIDIRRTDNVLTLEQAFIYARAAETWAGQVLLLDAKENKTDSQLDDWGSLLEPIPIDGGGLSVELFDQQARFNLNNLVDDSGKASKSDVEAFGRLLTAIEVDRSLAGAIVDWIDADINAGLTGAEDVEYLALDVPYRTANRQFASVSELRRIRGITDEIYKKIEPYVTVLPERTKVNVNTAKLPVFLAIIKGIDETTANSFIEQRKTEPYENESSFREQPTLEGLQVEGISVSSDYFMVEIKVQYGRSRTRQHSLINRKNSTNGEAEIIVMARSRGGLS
jgi:general secretion pathway protein K